MQGRPINDRSRDYRVRVAVFSPDGKFICSRDHMAARARVWQPSEEPDAAIWTIDDIRSDRMVWSPDGRLLALHTMFGLQLRMRNRAGSRLLWRSKEEAAGETAWSPDSRALCYGIAGAIVLCDAMTGRRQAEWPWTIRGNPVPIPTLAWAPDGRTIAAQAVGELRILDVRGGTVLSRFPTPPFPSQYNGLAFSPDGRYLACQGFTDGWLDAPVDVYDVQRGKKVFSKVCTGLAKIFAWAPSGATLLLGSYRVGTRWQFTGPTSGGSGLVAYDVRSGKEIWSVRARPVAWVAGAWIDSGKKVLVVDENAEVWSYDGW